MIETLLAVMLSSLMILPMAGWASFAMREQTRVQERNLSGASLGILRTYFQRDVSSASDAWVEGAPLTECRSGAKGERTLLMLADGERRTAYSLIPVDGFTSMLWRSECAAAGGAVEGRTDLASDVIDGGTMATCDSVGDLTAATAAAGIEVTAAASKKDASAVGEDVRSCRRVTLQLTTSQLQQVALTAMLRSGRAGAVANARAAGRCRGGIADRRPPPTHRAVQRQRLDRSRRRHAHLCMGLR